MRILHKIKNIIINLKIVWKLNISYSVLIIFSITVGFLSLLMRQTLSNKIGEIEAFHLPQALTASRARTDLLSMQGEIRAYLALNDIIHVDRYNKLKESFKNNLQIIIQNADRVLVDDVKENLTRITLLYDQWSPIIDHLMWLHNQPQENQPALKITNIDIFPLYNDTLHQLNILLEDREKTILSSKNIQIIQNILNLIKSFDSIISYISSYASSGNIEARYKYGEALLQHSSYWRSFKNSSIHFNNKQKELINIISKNRGKLLNLSNEIISIGESQQIFKDIYIFRQQAYPLANEILNLLNLINKKEETLLYQEFRSLREKLYYNQQQVIIINLLIIIFSVIMILFLKQLIIRPINEVMSAIKKIEKGNLNVKVPAMSKDELGILANSFNQMTFKLAETMTFLKEKRIKAESASKAKSTFLANMSHELRSPLNSILGFSNLLLRNSVIGKENLSSEQKENMILIKKSGEHLLSLINDILELSRIESGRTILKTTECDLYEILHNLEEIFSLKVINKNIKMKIETISELPQFIITDRTKLKQILINLIDNAVKFTKIGGVTLKVGIKEQQCISSNLKTLRLFFEVSDTGIGILQNEMKLLFEAFSQTQSGRILNEGTGLGLAISKQFVNLLGGELLAESQPGKGSIFSFEIDVGTVDTLYTPENLTKKYIIGLKPGTPVFRILIVDDNESSRKFLAKLLQSLGFNIQEAENGQKAIEKCKEFTHHLIWMDMRMPVLSGYEATQKIKASPGGEKIKIIAITASSFEEERSQVMASGCDDFLRKPFKENDLLEMMGKHLDLQWEYADQTVKEESKAENPEELEKKISSLSDELRKKLRDASVKAHVEEIETIIEEIRGHDEQAAEGLKQLVDQFDFTRIAEICGGKK